MGTRMIGMGLVAVLAVAGCGGSDGKKTAAATTIPPPTTALVGNDQAATPFCQLVRTYTEKSDALLASASDPVKLKAATTDAESAIRQAQATAPAEIKGDVTKVATTASTVLSALQKNNFDLTRTPDALAKLQDPGFQAALANVDRYGQAHCGIA